ncbi:MAG: hypothetical protein QNJ38_01265 [Prochloraceae cyanobacterium]|nr:hypothetical protein [Prochloraceae cyanobacterium]
MKELGLPMAYALLGKEDAEAWLYHCDQDRFDMINQQEDTENPKGLILFDSIKIAQLFWGKFETVLDKLFYWLKGLIPFSSS